MDNTYATNPHKPFGQSFWISDYQIPNLKHVETAHDIISHKDPKLQISSDYALWRVFIDNSRPVSIKVYEEESMWFAEQQWLNIMGTGKTKQAAIKDAEQHIEYFYEYYSTISLDRLTSHALELKNRFERISLTQQ